MLFARARDRVSALRSLYGEGPLGIDFRAPGSVHPLGGLVGVAEYEGEFGEFVPFLEAAQWTGVGRQTVWGKGRSG